MHWTHTLEAYIATVIGVLRPRRADVDLCQERKSSIETPEEPKSKNRLWMIVIDHWSLTVRAVSSTP